jgi:predicted transcriptional regulator
MQARYKILKQIQSAGAKPVKILDIVKGSGLSEEIVKGTCTSLETGGFLKGNHKGDVTYEITDAGKAHASFLEKSGAGR